MANSDLSVPRPGDLGDIVSSLVELGLKMILEAIFIFGGSILYFYDFVERYLVFSEVKVLYFFTGIGIIMSSLLYGAVKKRALLLFWTISLMLIILCIIFTCQKLDRLSIDHWRFIYNYVSFIAINAFIAFSVNWLYELAKKKLMKKKEIGERRKSEDEAYPRLG